MIVNWIKKMFEHSFEKQWFETYWAIDLHGVVFKPDYRKDPDHAEFYPFAKETLQMMSARKDIVMIMFTSSHPKEIEFYDKFLRENGIKFDHINENPGISSRHGNFGCYDKKFYFNVLMDDKAGYDPETEWFQLYNLFSEYACIDYFPDPSWSTKY